MSLYQCTLHPADNEGEMIHAGAAGLLSSYRGPNLRALAVAAES